MTVFPKRGVLPTVASTPVRLTLRNPEFATN